MLCLDLDLPFQRLINGTLLLGEAGKDNVKVDTDFLQRSLTLPQLENAVTIDESLENSQQRKVLRMLLFL